MFPLMTLSFKLKSMKREHQIQLLSQQCPPSSLVGLGTLGMEKHERGTGGDFMKVALALLLLCLMNQILLETLPP